MTTTARSTMTIGDYLLRRIREAGAAHIFGVPGDYNLELLQQLDEDDTLTWVGTCNELNAAYAADGYARINGIGALIVTHGVGATSAICGVAGAYSEHLPVICVCGSIPRKATDRGLMMHHTLGDRSQNNFLRAYAEVTVAQAQITPRNAAVEIDRLILTAWQEKLPVYLELPSDVAYLDIEAPIAPLEFVSPPSDRERLKSCSSAIVDLLSSAAAPAIFFDTDAGRFDLVDEIIELSEKLQLPIAATSPCKGMVDESFPFFVGVYGGAMSTPEVLKAIEGSDCLLAIAVRRTDGTSGFFSDSLPEVTIQARSYSVDIGDQNYQAVTLKEVLRTVIDMVSPVVDRGAPVHPSGRVAPAEPSAGRLTQANFWEVVQGFLQEGDVLIAENGTSMIAAGALRLPPNTTYVAAAVWGSIGYTLGSLLGTLFAAPERRQILFIGDGSFQLSAQELSTMLRHDLKPVIFLLNNAGYTIERAVLGKTAGYNDVANWAYAELPRVLCPGTSARSFVVETVDELKAALDTTHDGLLFIEAALPANDMPSALLTMGHAWGEFNYGQRGPQQGDALRL